VKVYVVVIVLSNAGDQVPVIPSIDVVGNADRLAPEQIGATAVNVGVIFGLTVIVNVAVVAHWPAVGVKVYVVVAVLSNAGDQVPVMPLFDVVGNADKLAPEQIGDTAVNVGVTFGLTVIVNVVVAQLPAVGVKVYVVVVVLSNAGDQVPVIPLVDVVGNADKLAPEHIGATAVNVGVIFGLTVTLTATLFDKAASVMRLMALLKASATRIFPSACTATPTGRENPEPRVAIVNELLCST
jgi:hypothetical protein